MKIKRIYTTVEKLTTPSGRDKFRPLLYIVNSKGLGVLSLLHANGFTKLEKVRREAHNTAKFLGVEFVDEI